jgi:hypothetical protein
MAIRAVMRQLDCEKKCHLQGRGCSQGRETDELDSDGGDVPAVDAVVRSGDISGTVAGQEENDVGDFFRGGEPPS